jgi:hypothetical protein
MIRSGVQILYGRPNNWGLAKRPKATVFEIVITGSNPVLPANNLGFA